MNPGIIFAFLALFAWGAGDFLIQKCTRRVGDWVAMFYVDFFATVGLLPFVYKNLWGLTATDWQLLFLVSIFNFAASIFDFDALRVGKISAMEPIYALEVGITASLAFVFLQETLNAGQGLLLILLVAGIVLVSVRTLEHFRSPRLEKGALIAVAATVLMGGTNFLYGVGSREVDPLVVNWITSACVVLICFAYLAVHSRTHELWSAWRQHKTLMVTTSVMDNSAWIFFSYATLFVPVAIATAISEGYIALAAFLGVVIGRERLSIHQWFGFLLAIGSAILLSFTV